MERTAATWIALFRDAWICQYHLYELDVSVTASDGHHLFGRSVDVPEAIIALCHECHMKHHSGQIDNDRLVELQIKRGLMSKIYAAQLDNRKTAGPQA